ncbi:MAG: lysozyme inhibitor LprI family protein [Candidatus Acidiferrum sp.]
MRHLAIAIAFLVASLPALAQDSVQYRACNDKAKTQGEMNACASEEAARVDTELNTVYRKLLSKAASQPEAVAKIKASERAWITYRDAYMDAMYPAKDKQAEYGSVYPMEADLLKAKLTRQQVAAVEEMLKQYSGT